MSINYTNENEVVFFLIFSVERLRACRQVYLVGESSLDNILSFVCLCKSSNLLEVSR